MPVYGHLSTRHELDGYEWSWTGSLAIATEHRGGSLLGYRDSSGFVTLVLAPRP